MSENENKVCPVSCKIEHHAMMFAFLAKHAIELCGEAGKDAILAHVPEYARVGARVKERGIVREHCDIYCGDELVGVSTSGTHSPTLGYGICMLRIKRAFVGSELTADVRGHKIALETVNLPFYRR